jgi:hypothetical protein
MLAVFTEFEKCIRCIIKQQYPCNVYLIKQSQNAYWIVKIDILKYMTRKGNNL